MVKNAHNKGEVCLDLGEKAKVNGTILSSRKLNDFPISLSSFRAEGYYVSKEVRQIASDEQLSRIYNSAVVKPKISSHSSKSALGQGYYFFFNWKLNLKIMFYNDVSFAYKEH